MIRSAAWRIPGLFACYAAAALVLFRAPFLGDRSWFASGDAAEQSYPWLLAVAHAARHGHLILWEFGSQAGVSLAGELQPGPFYPPTWLLGAIGLDGLALCNGYVLLHFALAAAGMHLLLRGERVSHAGALLGATLFAFAGYLPFQAGAQPNIFASLCWMPWVLLAARRAFAAPGWRAGLTAAMLAGLAGGLQIAAGHLHPFVHTSYAVMLLALVFALARRSPRPLLLGLAAQATALAFAAVPLWLAEQYLHLVYRWYATGMSRWPHAVPPDAYAAGSALRWSDLRGFLAPGTLAEQDGSLFIGPAAAILAVVGLCRRGAFIAGLGLLFLFALLLGLGGHLPLLNRLFAHLPLLPQLRTPIRAASLVSLAAAGLAGCGLDVVGRHLSRWRGWGAVGLALLLLACIWPVARFDAGIGLPRDNPAFPPIALGRNPALAALLRESGQEPPRAPLVDRVLCVPRDMIPPNAGDLLPVLNVMGQRATMMVSLFDELSRGWGPGPSRPLDELGVRWVVSDHPIDGLPLRAQGQGYRIYERPSALSVLWTLGPDGSRTPAPVQSAKWRDNTVLFRLRPSPAPAELVFAQPNYPGWVATVDGKPVALREHGLFPAISLQAGAHDVRFAYRPALLAPGFTTLLALAVLTWLLASGRADMRRGRSSAPDAQASGSAGGTTAGQG